jgi:mannose-6-phosphate isomerase
MFPLLEEGGYKTLYKSIMEEDQDRVNRILQPLLDRIVPAYQAGSLKKNDPDFWAARAALTFNEHELYDRGIFSIYLLNLVHLQPGEAIFQDAGILHAYLEGQNMEIMANSDNVLRGGLTPKHIDVNELMKHVTFRAHTPQIIKGSKVGEYEEVFTSPAPDFELSRVVLEKGQIAEMTSITTEIFIVMRGVVSMKEKAAGEILLSRGDAAVAFDDATITISANEPAELYRASVPEALV